MNAPLVYQLALARNQAAELSARAYHESGHAVTAWHLRYPVEYATVADVGDLCGMVSWVQRPVPGSDMRIDRLLIKAAGLQADLKAHGHAGVGDDHDFATGEAAVAALAAEHGVEPSEIRAACDCVAREILDSPKIWSAVVLLAAALMEHETLHRRQVDGIIRGVLAGAEQSGAERSKVRQ